MYVLAHQLSRHRRKCSPAACQRLSRNAFFIIIFYSFQLAVQGPGCECAGANGNAEAVKVRAQLHLPHPPSGA